MTVVKGIAAASASDSQPGARNDGVIRGLHASLDRATLEERVDRLASALRAQRPRVLGLIADNGPDWLLVDLACERIGLPIVPLPQFFTPSQVRHAANSTGMDALVCRASEAVHGLGFAFAASLPGISLPWFRRSTPPVKLPAATSKITFTSGTTGAPKGVCLSAPQQRAVARSLVDVTRSLDIRRHLSLLPLAVLLENIAGGYAPLMSGATCCVPPLAEVGVAGAASFDPLACLRAIERWQAHSVILLPQMLLALTAALETGAPRPRHLRFAAVGGARVTAALLARARAAGLPAYEGYGLSECSSVVALNVPGADRPGSVGRPLPHAAVRTAADGEIHVAGAGFLGYVGATGARERPVATGDLGRVDADGFVHIEGRRKHQLITSFGRNVAPEWPEAELLGSPSIAQAAVFGEARPRLCAVIVPRSEATPDDAIEAAVVCANQRLPDYAQVAFWIRAETPFGTAAGTATANGRIRRPAIWQSYRARIESAYASMGAFSDVLL